MSVLAVGLGGELPPKALRQARASEQISAAASQFLAELCAKEV